MSSWPLSTLDAVSWVMDRPARPLDFTLIVHSSRMRDVETLRAGATSALRRFPVTASTTDGSAWTPHPRLHPDLAHAHAASDGEARTLLQEFVDGPFDLRVQLPARQLLIEQARSRTSMLATRFHHAAADGRSAAMWLTHQFAAAGGDRSDVSPSAPFRPPSLRRAPKARRAANRRAAPLWHRSGRPSRTRRWHTIQFPCAHLRQRVHEIAAFTYNDLLATIALDTCARWNRAHAAAPEVALWLPVEIRRAGDAGFGNGTSRVRVHAAFAAEDAFRVKCRRVHDAVSSALRSGEWSVPEGVGVMRLPPWAMRPVLRGYLTRPWADVGTIAFSHVEHREGAPPGVAIDRVECVGPLHGSHACAIYGVTRGGCTSLTFTYDPALLSPDDIEAMAATYQDRVSLAARELACAA